MAVVAALLLVTGLVLAVGATRVRRRRWRGADPFTGDERGAPEPALVHPAIVQLVYLGWVLFLSGLVLGVLDMTVL